MSSGKKQLIIETLLHIVTSIAMCVAGIECSSGLTEAGKYQTPGENIMLRDIATLLNIRDHSGGGKLAESSETDKARYKGGLQSS